MKFKFTFTREITVTELVEREIEAATEEEACSIAEDMASEFNHSCPDDAMETSDGGEAGDWSAEQFEEISA